MSLYIAVYVMRSYLNIFGSKLFYHRWLLISTRPSAISKRS